MAEASTGGREPAAWDTSSHRRPPVMRCRHPRRQGHVRASGARSGVHAGGGRRLTPGRTGPGRPAPLRAAAYAVRRFGTRPAHRVPGRSSTVTAARRGPGSALRGSARWRAGRHREQRARTVPAWWRSSACRVGAGTGSEAYASWSSRSTPMPPGSSRGGSWPARRRGGGSRWRGCQHWRMAGARTQAKPGRRGCWRWAAGRQPPPLLSRARRYPRPSGRGGRNAPRLWRMMGSYLAPQRG